MRCALQLYSVRGAAARDFAGTLARVGGLGLDGVELAGLHGHEPADVRDWLDGVDLEAAGFFVRLEDLEADAAAVYAAAGTLGTSRVVVEWLAPSRESTVTQSYVDRLDRASRQARDAGFSLGFHTHDAELQEADDGSVLVDRLVAEAPELELELDLGWAWVAGRDPGDVLAALEGRCRAVHVKDFADRDDPSSFTSVGEGAVPFLDALRRAGGLEWIVAEQDDAFVPDELGAAARSAAALLRLRELATAD
ncbi:MAG TPA: TIM barrel protein [Gaiellaceae bacterium]|nr:TIM barrel protein [Gaiellaceae bacterium]